MKENSPKDIPKTFYLHQNMERLRTANSEVRSDCISLVVYAQRE